jgi:hypothetical protein
MNDIEISHRLANDAVTPARDAEKIVPCGPGFYSIIVDDPMNLPEPFGSILSKRGTPLLYIGVASKSLQERLVTQDLRHKRPSTFFRGIGAILGFRPPRGSLIGKGNQNNYRFDRADTEEIIAWIDKHASVRYIEVDTSQHPKAEALAISQHRPLVNKHHNPQALSVLEDLREECRRIALTAPDGTA